MVKLTNALYLNKQISHCAQNACALLKVTEAELMARAGYAALLTLRQQFPMANNLTIFCGSGHNGGDGFILARLAHEQGYKVIIHHYKAIENFPEAVRQAALQALAAGICFQNLEEVIDSDTDVIIDALLGSGLRGEVNIPLEAAINQMNESGLPIFSLDIPSGLDADTGEIKGAAVNATLTLTFIAKKIGMLMLAGPDLCGKIIVDSLQLDDYLSAFKPAASLLVPQLFYELLPPRARNSHKHQFGHVLIVGGGEGMPGAVLLTAHAALRVGAGMVTIATLPEHAHCLTTYLPEALIYGISASEQLLPLLNKATVCVIGPGLGEGSWANDLFDVVIAAQLPMLIDASALRILANYPQYDDNWVLTPHPGEAAGLLHCTTSEVQANRYQSIKTIQQQYGGTIVLKGAGSLVQTEELTTYLCDAGNPGMASPGMGDALSGIIAGLVAQGLSLGDASKWGVFMHAQAGDMAAHAQGERGLLARDLMPYLRQLVNHNHEK